MTRSDIFLIGAIGAVIYALHRSRYPGRPGAMQRTKRSGQPGQLEAKARWETDGGSAAPESAGSTT